MNVSTYTVDGPSVVIPARIALLLERHLKLDDLRVKVRGQNAEIDAVLSAWHAVAMQYVEELASDVGSGSDSTPEDGRRSSTQPLTAIEVANVAGITDRGVRDAADNGRLIGTTTIGGQWLFQPEDVAAWMATRNRAA